MSPSKIYRVGDLVFAKVRGWSPWPATVIRKESQSKYRVYFCATQQEGSVKEEFIWPYKKNKMAFTKKYGKRKGYKAALRQIKILDGSSCERSEESSEETGAEDKDKDDEFDLNQIALENTNYESDHNMGTVDDVVEVNIENALEYECSARNLIIETCSLVKSNNEARTTTNNGDRTSTTNGDRTSTTNGDRTSTTNGDRTTTTNGDRTSTTNGDRTTTTNGDRTTTTNGDRTTTTNGDRTTTNNEDGEPDIEPRNANPHMKRSAWCTDSRLPPGWQMMWYPGGSLDNVYRSPEGALFKTLDGVVEALENYAKDANSKVEEAVKDAKQAIHNLNQILMFKQEIESDHDKFNKNLNTIYLEETSHDKLKTQAEVIFVANVDTNNQNKINLSKEPLYKKSIESVNDEDIKIEDSEDDEETTYWNTLYNAATRPPVPNFYINPFFHK